MTSQIYLPQHNKSIIVNASWESRFLSGLIKLVTDIKPSKILMFYSHEYEHLSSENIKEVKKICKKKNINLTCLKLYSSDTARTWKIIVERVAKFINSENLVTLDISTMTREVVWYICHILSKQCVSIQFAYHKPISYSDWLSRDPGKPRMLYKQSGIQHMGRPTTLFIQTGFDVERVRQLYQFYDPTQLILGLQTGDQYGNIHNNRELHIEYFSRFRNVSFVDIDGYSSDSTYNTLYLHIEPLVSSANIIFSSLGPKVAAISLYLLQKVFPSISLSYAPSIEYNPKYSFGIANTIYGLINNQ